MFEAIAIIILVLVIFTFSKRIKEEQDKKLMWENRAIRLISKLQNETGRTYFFTDDICGIDSFVDDFNKDHEWTFEVPEENDKEQ